MYNHFRIMRMHNTRTRLMIDCYDCINGINFEIAFSDSINGLSYYSDLIQKYKTYSILNIDFNIDELICNFSERKIKINHNNLKEVK